MYLYVLLQLVILKKGGEMWGETGQLCLWCCRKNLVFWNPACDSRTTPGKSRLCLAGESLSYQVTLDSICERRSKTQAKRQTRAAAQGNCAWSAGQWRVNTHFCASSPGHKAHITSLHPSLKLRNRETFSSFAGGHICYFLSKRKIQELSNRAPIWTRRRCRKRSRRFPGLLSISRR